MGPSSLLVAVVATLLAVLLASGARRWMAFRSLARALGGRGVGGVFTASVGGVQYRCRYWSRAESHPTRLTVTIDAPPGPAFRVSRPSAGTSVLLALGLGRAVRTGVPVLDDGYVVACDAAEWAAALFRGDDAGAAVTDVIAGGFTEVRAEGAHLVAEWSPFAMTENVEPGVVAATVKHLVRLRDAVVAAPAPPELAALGEATRRRRALAVVPTVVLVVGVGLLVWVSFAFRLLDQRAVLLDSLRLSLPWLALFLVVGTQAFRLSTTSARDLARILTLALVGFPLTGYAAEVALNCGLDAAPPAEHRAVVVERTTTSGRSGMHYWAVVHSWRGAPAEYIPVSPAVYERLVPNRSEMAVVTRPGRLGFEWIVDDRLEG